MMKAIKKLTAALLTAVILSSSALSVSALQKPLPGDVNEDNSLTVSDMIMIKNIIMNSDVVGRMKKRADVDANGIVNVSDILTLKNYILSEYSAEFYPAETIADGETYFIENVTSGKMVQESTNGRVGQWTYTGAVSQQWRAVERDGYYMIVSLFNDRVWTMEDRRGTMWLYARDIADMSAPTDLQLFKFEKQEDGSYLIRSKSEESSVIQIENDGVNDDGRLMQGGADNSPSEKWSLIKAEGDPAEVLSDDFADRVFEEFMDNFYLPNGANGHVIKNYNYFWDYAEMMEMIIDAYDRTGDSKYMNMFDECYKGFTARFGEDWAWNAYNDDIMWMVIACCRAYLATGNDDYMVKARYHFDLVYERAFSASLGGGLYWKNGDTTTKNSCINDPAVIAATYLYEIYGLQQYSYIADQLFKWELDNLYEKDTGKVNDNIHYTNAGETTVNTNAWTYNQGTFIGAATRMYEMTEKEEYLGYAKKAADYTVYTMYKGGVINNEGGNKEYDDAHGFKGILMRWLGYYIDSQNDFDYDMWLAVNLYTGWNNRNSYNLVGTRWGSKTGENLIKPFSYYNYVSLAQIAPYDRIRQQLEASKTSVTPDLFVSEEQLASDPTSHSTVPSETAKFDQSLKGTPLSIVGTGYEKGISTNAEGYFEFFVPENAERFVGVFGVDDCAAPGGGAGTITCSIYFDGKLSAAYCSGVIKFGESTNINIPIPEGAKTMKILFGEAGDGDSWDNASIGNAGWVLKK